MPRAQKLPMTRSEMMAGIRDRATKPEEVTARAIRDLGLRYRRNVRSLPGKPDFANKTAKWAIMVHGCFWHQHENCRLASKPKSNAGYWTPKLAGNVARDKANRLALRKFGYRVLVLWECDTRRPGRIERSLARFF